MLAERRSGPIRSSLMFAGANTAGIRVGWDAVESEVAKARALANFVWSIADILRGDFKQFEYGKFILPFVVLRRLDCILEPTKAAVVAAHATLPEGIDDETRDMILSGAVGGGVRVYNTSQLTFAAMRSQEPANCMTISSLISGNSRRQSGMSSSTSFCLPTSSSA